MTVDTLQNALSAVGVAVYKGYAVTGATLPYMVIRPLSLLSEEESVGGPSMVWDSQNSIYCVAGSVEASHNLALAAMRAVEGNRVGGHYLSTSLGYVGALIEGAYETQVTTQVRKGTF